MDGLKHTIIGVAVLSQSLLPLDRIGKAEYEYDDAGNLAFVTNWDKKDSETRQIIAQNEYDYDARGSLLAEWQAIGALVGGNTPRISYAWDYENTDVGAGTGEQVGRLRLEEMEYPWVPGNPIRRITMDYGTTDGESDVLSRLEAMTSNLGEPIVAAFGYVGVSRRASLTLGASSAGGAWCRRSTPVPVSASKASTASGAWPTCTS